MIGTMGADVRDDWMKRTGPFYPLLVAFRLHSELPVANQLEPTEEDLSQVAPWIMGVAIVWGGALALLATALLWSPLVPAIAATLLVAVAAFVTGAYAERGLVRLVLRQPEADAHLGSGHLLAAALVRLGILLGTAPSAWVPALVLSALAGKLTYLVTVRAPWDLDTEAERQPLARGLSPVRWGIIGFIALLAAVAFAGAWGLAVVIVALGIGWLGTRYRGSGPAGFVGLAEVAALVLVAAIDPASVSPLIAP